MSLQPLGDSLSEVIDPANQIRGLESINIGTPEIIPPSEQIKYPYILYIPTNINPESVTNIMMWGAGSARALSVDAQSAETRETFPRHIKSICDRYQIACITPVLPRDRQKNTSLDAQILSRSTMIPSDDCPDYYRRPDVEILKMFRQVGLTLEENKYRIDKNNGVIVAGFSAGAVIANRLSVLYPEIIKASAVLSAGDYLYPQNAIDGQSINYPFGISDITAIDGQRFNLEAFKRIKQFLYVGMQDMEENRDPFLHDLNGDRELESRLRPLLGRNQAIRCLNYVNYLNELGVNPEFAYRDDLGHSTDPDVWAKFEKFISKIAKQ